MAQPPAAAATAAPSAAMAPAATADPSDAEKQRALLMQIMALTAEQINALPPQQRDQILQLVVLHRHAVHSPHSLARAARPAEPLIVDFT